MSRELIEAAKAVIADRDHLGAMFEWEGNDVLTSPNAVRWQAFVAAVRAAEAAPVADAERVLEAAKAAVIAIPGFKNISALSQWVVGLVADAIRPYIAPAPVADTVAVPVETLRELRLIATKPLTDQDCRNVCAAVRLTIDALLPPREPPRELVEAWERRGEDYADSYPFSDTWDNLHRDSVIHAVRDTLRALWAADPKNGGGA